MEQPAPALEAFQARLTLLLVTPEADSPDGTLGAAVQACPASVVTESAALEAEVPAASTEATVNE